MTLYHRRESESESALTQCKLTVAMEVEANRVSAVEIF
jgi:hypothetical protein